MRTKLGDYIRDARERLGALLDGEPWRQEDLAELLGVQKSTVFKWEQGQRTASQADLNHIDRCIRLAELGIDPRTVRAADAMELAREQADPVMRGFPKGRSRLVS